MIVFISCVKKKSDKPSKARYLYTSPLFKKMLAYAESLNPSKIYILSAKYGVVSPDDVISPYEATLGNMNVRARKTWARKVLTQLKNDNVDFGDKAVFLCGKRYREYIMPFFRDSTAPLARMGIGKQLKYLSDRLV